MNELRKDVRTELRLVSASVIPYDQVETNKHWKALLIPGVSILGHLVISMDALTYLGKKEILSLAHILPPLEHQNAFTAPNLTFPSRRRLVQSC